MKKGFIIIISSLMLTSCSIQDVINYLSGKPNDLNEEEKIKVEQELNANTISSLTAKEDDIDKGGTIRPPQN